MEFNVDEGIVKMATINQLMVQKSTLAKNCIWNMSHVKSNFILCLQDSLFMSSIEYKPMTTIFVIYALLLVSYGIFRKQ